MNNQFKISYDKDGNFFELTQDFDRDHIFYFTTVFFRASVKAKDNNVRYLSDLLKVNALRVLNSKEKQCAFVDFENKCKEIIKDGSYRLKKGV